LPKDAVGAVALALTQKPTQGLHAIAHKGCPVRDLKLRVYVMKMNLDGAFLKVELPTNFLVGEATGNQISDFPARVPSIRHRDVLALATDTCLSPSLKLCPITH